jgi:phosphoribosylformylglycinamidine synthase
VALPAADRPELTLFGEGPSRVAITVKPGSSQRLESLAREAAVPAVQLGQTGGDRLRIAVGGQELVDLTVARMWKVYREAIPCLSQ